MINSSLLFYATVSYKIGFCLISSFPFTQLTKSLKNPIKVIVVLLSAKVECLRLCHRWLVRATQVKVTVRNAEISTTRKVL